MSEIIGNITIGIVLLFCAVAAYCILSPGKAPGRKTRKQDPAKDSGRRDPNQKG